jgi:hypothetical protein
MARECPKCQGSMKEGFIIDHTHGGARTVGSWVEGKPEKSIWTGLKLGGRKPAPIEVWRCSRCGFLESYAPPA